MSNVQVVTVSSQIQDFLDEMEEFDRMSIAKPPAPVVKLPHDPVACACASYRVWKENPARRWEDLETVVVWQDDIEKAEQLKKYYRESMVMEALKSPTGINRSSFRKKLALLAVNELVITKEEIGLLLRLPYFYEEDLALDSIVSQTDDSLVKFQTSRISITDTELTPITKILVSRRVGDYYHYWFKDENSTPYKLVIKHDNTLLKLFDRLYQQPTLKVNADIYPKSMQGYRGHNFYQLGSVELA